MPQKPDYGIDAPGVVRNLLVIGAALIISGIVFPTIHLGNVTILWSRSAIWPGASCLVGGLLMVIYAKWGKFRHRDMMLNMLRWRGDERVLDVGTGRGLLLIGAARRLTTGTGQALTFGAPRIFPAIRWSARKPILTLKAFATKWISRVMTRVSSASPMPVSMSCFRISASTTFLKRRAVLKPAAKLRACSSPAVPH